MTPPRLLVQVFDGTTWLSSTGPSQPSETRDPLLWPFTSSSFWNMPIGDGISLGSVDTALAGTPGQLNYATYSTPVNQGGAVDPPITLREVAAGTWGPGLGDTIVQHTPATVTLAGDMAIANPVYNGNNSISFTGTPDGFMALVDTVKGTVTEAYKVCWSDSGSASRVLICRSGTIRSWDLRATSAAGARASGLPFLAGLIRAWELDKASTDPNNAIRHALSLALPNNLLLKPSSDSTYSTPGHQWPATSQDSDANSAYSGAIRMGTQFVLDPNFDHTLAAASNEDLALGYALRDYGVFIVDRSAYASLYGEQSMNPAAAARLKTAWQRLIQHMVPVLNNDASNPGGPGTRVRPLAPDFATDSPAYRTQKPWLDPFPSDHFINVPIGSGITMESTSSAKHLAVVGSVASVKYVDWSDPVYLANNTDAQFTVRHIASLPSGWDSLTNTQLGTPTGAGSTVAEYPGIYVNTRGSAGDAEWATWQSVNNTDRKVHNFQPDGRYVAEMHKFYRTTTSNLIFVTNWAYTDVVYDYGLTKGAIASNISAILGAVRAWEVQAALAGDRYAIKHALKLSASNDMLIMGPLWPSKNQDGDASTAYSGVLPYGTHIFLPISVNVDAIAGTGSAQADLNAAVLHALQLFGAYILIRANNGSILGFSFEPRAPKLTSTQANGVQSALNTAIPSLRVSSNSHSVGTLNTNRQPAAGVSVIAGGGTRVTAGLGLDGFDINGYKLPINPDSATWI